MAKKYNSTEGIWRTIGGRRVFIKTGQSLSDAMKESGKFKKTESENKTKTNTIPRDYNKITYTQKIESSAGKVGDKFELTKDEYGQTITKNLRTGETYQANMSMLRSSEAVEINDIEDKFYTRKDGTKEYDPYKGTRFEKKYDSVEQRYNNDSDFRNMLEKEHQKTLNATRKEVRSYFDLSQSERDGIGTKDDLYKMINENYYNIDKEDFDKLYSEEAKIRYAKVDKEWQDLVNKMSKDYDEFGTNNWKDEKRLNELSAERDRLSIYNDENESKYLKARNEEIRYERALGEYKGGKDEGEKIKKTGNDYLPKASKITTQGTSNRKEVSDNIQAHILEHYDNPVDFMEQMDAMDYLPTRWRAGEELARGGNYLIYNGDMADFLNSLNINPKGKTFSPEKSFDMYSSLVGRESERLYNRLEKLYEQYKSEHKGSDVSLDDFRKWFK